MPDSHTLSALAGRLGHTFSQPDLLKQALTHRSFAAQHNERLEFLGDAVLNLCISHWLMQRLPGTSEGMLSRTRANLVREESLHQIAQRLQLSEALYLGEGEQKSGGRLRTSILADAVEAVIGAVYLDAGFESAQRLVLQLFEGVEISSSAQVTEKDAKTRLQEVLQAQHLALPAYQVEQIRGADHKQVFVVECRIEALQLQSRGEGQSRKAAEQQAASQMLGQLAGHAGARRGSRK
ncbi:ribonuclease III [Corticibacter populi]|uniref:Ribonuclease 3 n=1 Tax=Corticibacter populi TaxID=1550736 RepID=A0A3M6R0V0_9BURK|nr:ribonuclease III [Corticibacter populi]